jgi:hypothetical protein
MPFAPKMKDEQQNQVSGGSQNISGISASFNVPGQNAGAATKGAKSSGQYQNLQKYLSANQEQGTQMGQQVASGVEQKVQSGKQALGGLQSQVQKTTAYDPNEAIQKAQSGQLTEQEKQAYKTTKQTGGYTGAKDVSGLTGYGEAQKAFGSASEAVSQTGNEAGQQQLLKSTYARPNYSQGANKLDQVLLGQSSGGKQALENLGQKYAGLTKEFSSGIEQSQKDIAGSQDQAAANKSAIGQAEQASMSGLMSPIEQRVAQANIENPALQQRLTQDIQDELLKQETLDKLGLSSGQNIYDLNLASYLSTPQAQMNANTMATQEERQKYKALTDLFEQPGGELSDVNPMSDYKPYSFDTERFQKDVGSKKAEYQAIQDTKAGDLIQIDPGSSSGLGLKTDLANALSSMNVAQITSWYNSLPDTSRNAGVTTKDSYQVKQLKAQLDQLNNMYNPNRVVGLEA